MRGDRFACRSSVPMIGNYRLPSMDFLQHADMTAKPTESKEELMANARLMQQTLAQFDIEVSLGDITKGPTITRYEVYPAKGVRVDKIVSLERDLAQGLAGEPRGRDQAPGGSGPRSSPRAGTRHARRHASSVATCAGWSFRPASTRTDSGRSPTARAGCAWSGCSPGFRPRPGRESSASRYGVTESSSAGTP